MHEPGTESSVGKRGTREDPGTEVDPGITCGLGCAVR